MKKILLFVCYSSLLLINVINGYIQQALIPAAGFGTRFLPFTKVVPKELVPISQGKPVIEYVVQEAVESGIIDVSIIVNEKKWCLVDYFKPDKKLNVLLEARNKLDFIKALNDLSLKIHVRGVLQKKQLGLGHAILCAKEVIKDDFFAVLLPDNIITSKVAAIAQLIEISEKYHANVIAIEKVGTENINAYAEVQLAKKLEENLFIVKKIREKPPLDEIISSYSIIGRAVLSRDIFHALEQIRPDARGEYNWTDAMQYMIEQGDTFLAYEVDGRRFDTGRPKKWAEAVAFYTEHEKL